MSGVKRAARVLEIVVVVIIVLLVAATFVPTGYRKYSVRTAEVKANLHNIQLSIERFAVDQDGAYPQYLTGGGARCAAVVDEDSNGDVFREIQFDRDMAKLTDPLLREGYLDEYPRNPFVRNGVTVHQAQLTLPLNAPGGDPLRNGVETGRLYGTRFGPYCTSMGQVLGAKYYCPVFNEPLRGTVNATGTTALNVTDMTTALIPGLPTGADVTYPCWDVWKSNKASNPLPGQFIYAGTGPVIALGSPSDSGKYTGLPTEIDNYILAAFGGSRSKGEDCMDSIGIPFFFKPFNPVRPSDGVSMQYGNPNGIPDGIILMLHFMEDIQYDKR